MDKSIILSEESNIQRDVYSRKSLHIDTDFRPTKQYYTLLTGTFGCGNENIFMHGK